MEDLEHFFCACDMVSEVWGWIRGRMIELLGWNNAAVSNWELLNLFLPGSSKRKELVWMLGTYVAKVWEDVHVRGKTRVRWETFFGFLSFKYKAAQLGARLSLDVNPGLV